MKEKTIKTLRFSARITSIAILLVFLIFFVGEGIVSNLETLKIEDILLLSLIPGLLLVGTIIAWKRELLGGIIICISILTFNFIDYFLHSDTAFSPNFLIIILVGILFIIVGINKKIK